MIRRLYRKIIIGLIIIFVLDSVIGAGLRYLYFHRAYGNRKNLIYIIEEMNDPIVIMGSSRAQSHYVPSLFQSVFDQSCFNAGLGGTYIEYHEALLESVLNRYVPNVVILDFQANEFEKLPSRRLKSLSRIFPFYAEHPELRPLINSCGPTERVKMLSRIYPFNSEIYQIMIPYFISRRRLPDYPDGYFLNSKVGSFQPLMIEGYSQSILDIDAMKAFDNFVSRAKGKGISLYVIVSPSLEEYQEPTKSMDYAQSVCNHHGVPFWDMSSYASILSHPEYFQDRLHMNDKGARIFSRVVIDRVKEFRSNNEGKPLLKRDH
jgi:hypothetical protein